MIYALGSSLVDNCGCVQQCSFCSFLVLCFDCNTNLLNSGLNRRFDCFVSFSLSKRQYELVTGRRQKSDVIAYQIRQSFKPGEITAEEANKVDFQTI